MKRRRGVSLVEVIIVVGASTMVLTVGMGLMHKLLRSERSAAESLIHANSHARMSLQFREDAHAATGASVEGEPGAEQTLRLTSDEGTAISYAQRDRFLIRAESRADGDARYEQYRLPRDVRVQFAVNENGPLTVAELVWARTSDADPAINAPAALAVRRRLDPLRIEAVVGKDRRFEEAVP